MLRAQYELERKEYEMDTRNFDRQLEQLCDETQKLKSAIQQKLQVVEAQTTEK